ncbi:MAG: DUF4339 domain-containing protein [Kiritimatiellae bacterium]|nr:DUF4339 domain-containing protein [Kiritimatiellia bacterium]
METPQAIWYYATADSGTVGPLTPEALSAAVASGAVAPDTAVWRAEFGNRWRAAATVPELLPAWRAAEAARVENAERSVSPSLASPGAALAEAFAGVRSLLFRPFRILAWVSLAFCNMMASSRMLAMPGGVATPPARIPADATAADQLAALLAYVRDSAASVFSPRLSVIWLATAAIYGLFTAYIAAKGRLLFVGRTYFPEEPLPALWRRTIGRTASLWRLCFLLDAAVNLALFLGLRRFFLASGLADPATTIDAEAAVAALSSGAARWLAASLGGIALLEIVRSLAFHFAEPAIFLLGIPVVSAARIFWRAVSAAPSRFCGFIALVVLIRAVHLGAVFAAAAMLPQAALAAFALVSLLPVNFLVRSLSARILVLQANK